MTSHPGGHRSDLRRLPPSHSLSSLSPLAAPYNAGSRPLASDPMNPPTAPSFHSSAYQSANPSSNYQSDGFRFSAEADVEFYPPYGAWKPSWAPDASDGEESASWMDPSLSYHVSSVDKGKRPPLNFPSYSDPPTNPTTSRTNPVPNPYRFVPESTSDPFSTGFRSSVVGPMLKEVFSDSFSVPSSPYDKYMGQLESCSSPTRPDPFDPCRISFDYFDYMQNSDKKGTAHVPVSVPVVPVPKVRVSIKAPTSKGGNETGTEKLKVKCGTSLDELLKSTGTGTSERNEVLPDQRSDDVDSPCWKGMPAKQQPFSEGQNSNLPTAPSENENPSFVDKKLKSVVVEPSEEKPKEEKTGSNSELEASSSLNKQAIEMGEKLGQKMDVKLLIKSMHDLSQVLLGFCGEDFELGDFESELLNGAIQNLKSFTGGNKYKNINTWKIYDNIKACGYSQQAINEGNSQINLSSNDYKKSILEGVEKLPKGDSDEQAELYKNLWLEAEVALCTMKYELQLAKTKSKSETLNKNTQEVESSGSLGEQKPSDPIKPDKSFFKNQPKQQTVDSTLKNESPKIKENIKTTDDFKTETLSWSQFKPVGQEGQSSNFSPSFGPVGLEGQTGNYISSFGPVGPEGQNSNFNPSFGPVGQGGPNGDYISSFGPVRPEGQNSNFNSSFGPVRQEGQIRDFKASFWPLGTEGQNSNFKPSFGPVGTEGQNSNFKPSFGPVGTEGQNSNFKPSFGPVGTEGQDGKFNPSFGPVGTEGQDGKFNPSFGPVGTEGQNSNFSPSFGPVGPEGQNSNFSPSFGLVGTEGQNGNFNPSFGQNETAENTVMARLRILQRRDENNINNFNGENSYFPNYYSLGYNNTNTNTNNNDLSETHNYSSEWEHVAKDEL